MSDVKIRAARISDHEAIAGFTAATFSWGDYVSDAFADWLKDPQSHVAVAVVDDMPVAIARAVMMSENEGWMHGARVHPEHRRKGIATQLNDHLCRWASDQGALIVRLMIESWNEPAQRQVAAGGYRKVCEWMNAVLQLGSEPDPVANGGRRVRGDEQFTAGTPAEIEPAWVAWSSSALSRVGRNLYPRGWLMRRMRREDLDQAVALRHLLHGPSGWIVAEDEDDGKTMFVPLIVSTEDDAYRLVKALVDRADRNNYPRIRCLVPGVDWMIEALSRAGFDVAGEQVWAKTVG